MAATLPDYREILRLASMGRSPSEIHLICGNSTETIKKTLALAKKSGLCWPLPEDLTNRRIRKIFYPDWGGSPSEYRAPDYEWVHAELKKRGVTRELLYREYRAVCEAEDERPCSRSTFNEGYAKWAKSKNVTMHIEHKPGTCMETDWAGQTGHVVDRDSGEILDVYIFVATLSFSQKTFAEGFFSMQSECWLSGHVDAFDFFGGVTDHITPDNTKTAVVSRSKDEIVINRAYAELAAYYGCAVMPARVRKPRDKSRVEAAVGLVERQALAALRDRTFFSLGEFNAALASKVDEINDRPFSKRPGSRNSVFQNQESETLSPLPKEPFPICTWSRATVRSDHHVAVDRCFYSVPFEYTNRLVDIRVTVHAVEIFHEGTRIASHIRADGDHIWVTDDAHRPADHQSYLTYTAASLIEDAAGVGKSCETAARLLLECQGDESRSCKMIKTLLALSERFGAPILERACAKMLSIIGDGPLSVESVEALCAALYKTEGAIEDKGAHALLRGADYYKQIGEDDFDEQ